VFIAPLSIQIRRAGVQKKFGGRARGDGPCRLGEARLTDLIDDRRFAETIYRVTLADGIMDRVTYQDPPEDAS
jgi:hypothetical protein